MRILGAILIISLAVVLVALLLGPVRAWAATRTQAARRRRDERRTRKLRATATWRHYCRPTLTGQISIGVELVTPDGALIEGPIETDRLPGDVDELTRFVAVDRARHRAAAYNEPV